MTAGGGFAGGNAASFNTGQGGDGGLGGGLALFPPGASNKGQSGEGGQGRTSGDAIGGAGASALRGGIGGFTGSHGPLPAALLAQVRAGGNFRAVLRACLSALFCIFSYAAPGQPIVRTATPSSVMGSSATLKGSVIPGGLGTGAWFEWGTNAPYGYTTAVTNTGNGSVAVPVSVTVCSSRRAGRRNKPCSRLRWAPGRCR